MVRHTKVKDPVCGMLVDPSEHALVYLQIHYAFCSLQCRQNFEANPGLYAGRPGHKAPRQEGTAVIKRRHLHLAEPVPAVCVEPIREALLALMGVTEVVVDNDRIEITYDLLQVTAEQIEAVILACEFPLGEAWRDRVHRAWVHYSEEQTLSSMAVPQTGQQSGCH